MRVVYPETTPEQNFQAKVWVGGDSEDDAEYINNKVRTVVAYLRSIDNRLNSWTMTDPDLGRREDEERDPTTYQLQQWRNIDPGATAPTIYDDKWQLKPLDYASAYDNHHLRAPRPYDQSDPYESFTFKIDKSKFAAGNYQYKVISFEKLEKKLHLMSKMDNLPNYPPYQHIEDELVVQDIWDNLGYFGTGYNDSPIVAEGTFTAESGDETVVIQPMWFNDPEGSPNPPISLTDFVIYIKPD